MADEGQELSSDRRDSIVDSAFEGEEMEMSKELEEELFGTTSEDNSLDVSNLLNAIDAVDENSPADGIKAATAAAVNTNGVHLPQLAVNEKRDSKTDHDKSQLGSKDVQGEVQQTPVPQQTRRKYGEKRPGPPLSAQTNSTSESENLTLMPGNEAIEQTKTNILSKEAQNAAGEPSTHDQVELTASSESAAMPLPAASASILLNITASDTAKDEDEQNHDLFVCGRLAWAVVTLFRMGKAKEAEALGQYTIDLIGEDMWNEWLAEYLYTEEVEGAPECLEGFLQDVVAELKKTDPASSGFLTVLMPFLLA